MRNFSPALVVVAIVESVAEETDPVQTDAKCPEMGLPSLPPLPFNRCNVTILEGG